MEKFPVIFQGKKNIYGCGFMSPKGVEVICGEEESLWVEYTELNKHLIPSEWRMKMDQKIASQK